MKLKVKCPDCGKTSLLDTQYLTRMVACPSCKCDFVPARDAFLSCPKCGSIIAADKDFMRRRLSCLECGFVLPRAPLARLKSRLSLILVPRHP
jgi:ribosomal protein S27AE